MAWLSCTLRFEHALSTLIPRFLKLYFLEHKMSSHYEYIAAKLYGCRFRPKHTCLFCCVETDTKVSGLFSYVAISFQLRLSTATYILYSWIFLLTYQLWLLGTLLTNKYITD